MRKGMLGVVAALALAASGASAGGGRIYPGGVCQPVSGLQNQDTIRDQDLWWNGSGDAQFMCPIESARIKGTKGVREVAMFVQPGGATLSCRIVSKSGTSSLSGDTVSSSLNEDTVLLLTLLERLEGSSVFVRCALPPGGRIRSYRVVE